MSRSAPIPVLLRRHEAYDDALAPAVSALLRAAGCDAQGGFGQGTRVLVKPNLIAASVDGLASTHPQVVRAVCLHLLDLGCAVTVGDSPAFGTALNVARKIGLLEALADLPVPVRRLGRPASIRLTCGGSIGVSRLALEADRIVNAPKCKVHQQLRLSLAVKNCFGCVPGMRKALAHAQHGDKGVRFESMLHDIHAALPPMVHLLDGVVAMHRRGPLDGEAHPLGLLAASASAVALDAAVASLLGCRPEDSALWRESLRRNLPGARLDDLAFPLASPGDFPAQGFVIPDTLRPVTFDPLRLARSACKRLRARVG